MKLAVFIAFRYLVSKKSTNIINLITWVTMLGMGVGAMAMVLVLSVFNGFETLVLSLYAEFDPDIKIEAVEGKTFEPDSGMTAAIGGVPGVVALSGVLQENCILKYRDKEYIATLKGVEKDFSQVTGMEKFVARGEFALSHNGQDGLFMGTGVELGLAVDFENPFHQVMVFVPKRGAKVAVNPEQAFNRGALLPMGSFSIQQEFDSKYGLVPIHFMRSLLNYPTALSAIEIRLSDGADPVAAKREISRLIGNQFKVRTRYEQNEFLYRVMQTEKWAVFAILSFILLVAAFNIIGSLSMLVIEKKKDIQILKTLGADNSLILKIFLTEGLLTSLSGSAVGILIAVGLCLLQIEYGLIRLQGSGSFVISAYPVKMLFSDFVIVTLIILLISLGASWIPSWRAARQEMLIREE